MANYQRGSEWRRWDLHLHTPGTIKNDQFIGATIEEKWDNFYSDIANYIGDGTDQVKTIVALGITDYLSIDNYRKVISGNRLPSSVKLVIPNIEMRMIPTASTSPVNIHFLFNPLVVDSIESQFFGKLSFRYGQTSFSATKTELIRLGKTLNASYNNEIAYKKGIEQYVVSPESIMKIFDDNPKLREQVIIAVANSTNDGVSGVHHNSNGSEPQTLMLEQSIYMFADVIFSAKPSDINYFLGKKVNCPPETVISQCGALMPCVHGSDAHDNSRIFEPDQNRYCWIKADPTFNGLKQVKYEPAERVRISATKPEKKPSYFVLDRIEISDEDFQSEPIYFNDKLNCIIGGKSTGKSILLHNLALTLDKGQVVEKDKTSQTRTKKDLSLTVYWADGKSEKEYPSGERKIVYIPQTYLNKLCDTQAERTEIDSIIHDVVLQRDPNAKIVFDRVASNVKIAKQEYGKLVLDLIEVYKDGSEITAQMREIGDKNGIIAEKGKLTKEKENLAKESTLTAEEITNYEDATAQISTLMTEIVAIDNEIAAINAIITLVEPKQLAYKFSDYTKSTIDEIQNRIVANADAEWQNERENLIATLTASKVLKDGALSKAQQIEESLKEKISENKAIAELTERLKSESDKLTKIGVLEVEKSDKEKHISKLIERITDSIAQFETIHKEFADTVNNNTTIETEDLEFSVEVPFRNEAFLIKLSEIFPKNSVMYKDLIKPDEIDYERHRGDVIKEIALKTLSGELPLKQGNTAESALRDIFDDWYEVKYTVVMGNDSIDVMSPGKKALVLLKLLIELAESECPILIDQPEDDLDNRSIFDELIEFIKTKKKERQIIIVTHNANIVVGADSEEVIVANQRGNNTPNKAKRFEYRSGSIENNTTISKSEGAAEYGILNSHGIQQHICSILEGGPRAFELRRQKYHIKNGIHQDE